MQIAAAGRRRNILHFHFLLKENVISALERRQPHTKFSFGEVYHWIYVRYNVYGSNRISADIPPKMKKSEYSYPHSGLHFLVTLCIDVRNNVTIYCKILAFSRKNAISKLFLGHMAIKIKH